MLKPTIATTNSKVPMILTLGPEELINLIRLWEANTMNADARLQSIDERAQITFSVPGGGDYSGMECEVTEDSITIRWED